MTVYSDPLPDRTDGAIHDLIEVCEDGARGFAAAAELLDGELKSTFEQLGAERQRLAAELHELATRLGVSRPESGSVKAAAHRAWMRLKDMAPGDNTHAVISAAEEGEDYALEQYDEALDAGLVEEARNVVARQRTEVKASHDRVRSLQAATA